MSLNFLLYIYYMLFFYFCQIYVAKYYALPQFQKERFNFHFCSAKPYGNAQIKTGTGNERSECQYRWIAKGSRQKDKEYSIIDITINVITILYYIYIISHIIIHVKPHSSLCKFDNNKKYMI